MGKRQERSGGGGQKSWRFSQLNLVLFKKKIIWACPLQRIFFWKMIIAIDEVGLSVPSPRLVKGEYSL
jgi:hypothetical protein